MPVTISLVEANHDLRVCLALLLNGVPGLFCVGSHGSAEEALQKIPLERPNVVLMDLHLRGMSGIECMSRLKTQLPQLPVLMLAGPEHGDLGFESICAGADGWLMKHSPPAQMIDAIEQIHAGGAPMTMQTARKVLDYMGQMHKSKSQNDVLASHEREVIELISKGYSRKEIAENLGISAANLRAQLQSVYKKLRMTSGFHTARTVHPNM